MLRIYSCWSRLLLLFIFQGVWWAARGIRLTSVHIPTHAVRGQDIELECEFDLEGEVLYTVKWYKDGKEFYQFVPAHQPPKQAFPLPGVSVDLERSTRSTVTLESPNLRSSGIYRCEVSGEAPNFNTVSDGHSMEVVVLPKEGPVITGGNPQYIIGDVADLNCTSAASRPEAQLSWLINGRPAPRPYLHEVWTQAVPNGTLVVTVRLRFRVTSEHFTYGYMKIKCVATIASVYEQWDGHSAEGVDMRRPLAPEPVVHSAASEGHDTNPEPAPAPDLEDDEHSSGTYIQAGNGYTTAAVLQAIVCVIQINRR